MKTNNKFKIEKNQASMFDRVAAHEEVFTPSQFAFFQTKVKNIKLYS